MAPICATRSSGSAADAAVAARLERASILAHARRSAGLAWAPPGYDEIDIRVLDWIATQRRGRPLRCSA
jgi:hypothetical protein